MNIGVRSKVQVAAIFAFHFLEHPGVFMPEPLEHSRVHGYADRGFVPLVPPQNLRGMTPERHEQFMALLANCMTGYRTFAHDYLVWGRMERPLTLDVPRRRLPWSLGGKTQQDLVVPAVSHEVWSLHDGRVGVVLVNPELEAHELRVDLSPLIAAGREPTIRQVSTQGGDRKHTSPNVHLEIAPLDMLLLEILP